MPYDAFYLAAEAVIADQRPARDLSYPQQCARRAAAFYKHALDNPPTPRPIGSAPVPPPERHRHPSDRDERS